MLLGFQALGSAQDLCRDRNLLQVAVAAFCIPTS